MPDLQDNSTQDPPPRWEPLSAIDRRIAGVLVEKAKTTPTAYPMSSNAIRTGCNQKSNRFPIMQLEDDDVIQGLDRLRGLGAVSEVQASGRVPKYRHLLYDWLGVDKVEIAVVAELLLRGAQTIGELRGRTARMEPIADLTALRPVLAALKEKGLIVYLTPEGRGCIVTHTLYRPQEMEKLQKQYAGGATAGVDEPAAESRAAPVPSAPPNLQQAPHAAAANDAEIDALRQVVEDLRAETQQLRDDMERVSGELRAEVDDIKQQLGI